MREARWRRSAVLLLALASLAEPVVEMLTTDRAHYVEGAVTAPRPLVEATTELSNAVIPLIAVAALLAALLWSRVDGVALLIVSLPSLVMTADEFVHGRTVGPSLLLPAFAGVLLVTARVKFEDLRLLGHLGAVVAAVSMIGWWVAPAMVLMSAGLAHAEKSVTGAPLLAGIFSHSNLLGLFLTASLPFAFLERRFLLRWAMVLSIAAALVLTSSRTALFGAGVVLGAILVGWLLPHVAFRAVTAVGAVALSIAVVQVPFTETDPSAYTDRGGIWMYNIGLLPGHWLTGRGAWFYSDNYAQFVSALSTAASHAHNSLLTLLVMGGLILIGAVVILLLCAWCGIDGMEDRRHMFVAGAFLLGLLALGITETTVRFAAWGPLSACFLVPLFVLVSEWRARTAAGRATSADSVPTSLLPVQPA